MRKSIILKIVGIIAAIVGVVTVVAVVIKKIRKVNLNIELSDNGYNEECEDLFDEED